MKECDIYEFNGTEGEVVQCLVPRGADPVTEFRRQHGSIGDMIGLVGQISAVALTAYIKSLQKPENGDEKERCCAVWDAYPKCNRKVAKPLSLRKIKKAIADHGFAHVLGATVAYSFAVSLWSDRDKEYVPSPATFYGQARYNDPPETWQRNGAAPKTTGDAW